MIPTKLKPGCGAARYLARFQYNRGATQSLLMNKGFRATGFANPSGVRLYEILAWRLLGSLVSRRTSRSWEARIALHRRYGKVPRPNPKFHPTDAERMQQAIARHQFRKQRAIGEYA